MTIPDRSRALKKPLVQQRVRLVISPFQIFSGVIFALSCIQIAIGGDVYIVGYCIISIVIGLIPIRLFGLESSFGLLFAALLFFFPVSALFIKTVLLQPIQSRLFVPDLSFQIMVLGMAGATFAAVILYSCKRFLKIKPIFQPLAPRALNNVCIVSIIIAILGILGQQLPGAVGRISALTAGMIYLSLIAATQLALVRSNGQRSISYMSGSLFLFCALYGIMTNSKQGLLASLFCYVVTVYIYRRKFDPKSTVAIVSCFILFFFVVSPAINIVRAVRADVGALELIGRTFATSVDLLVGNRQQLTEITTYDFDDRYYVRYVSDTTSAIDRMAFISYIDAILRFSSDVFQGYTPLLETAKEAVIPNIVDPGKKVALGNGDAVLQQFGVYDEEFAAMITFPLFSEGYVTDGYQGVIILTFVAYLVLGVVMTFIFGNLPGNVFAIWIISEQGFLMVGSGLTGILFFSIRIVPVYVLLYLLCRRV